MLSFFILNIDYDDSPPYILYKSIYFEVIKIFVFFVCELISLLKYWMNYR